MFREGAYAMSNTTARLGPVFIDNLSRVEKICLRRSSFHHCSVGTRAGLLESTMTCLKSGKQQVDNVEKSNRIMTKQLPSSGSADFREQHLEVPKRRAPDSLTARSLARSTRSWRLTVKVLDRSNSGLLVADEDPTYKD
jgi:hypothetical protein